ncbi:hypothetical protein D2T29_22475 [Sinirhodobacter populi]|uniref:Uncharacterized protein n=1 Tax=Paenirhodobacter populi TaxID=2306993 RepID=A0A443JWQ6_9RHOB|nr:hypothetical protein [Sinirhodobacter populi]RWR24940.1 hypothetical protein D2T29_22475 [Sinirhodobacter populi]
MALSQRTATTPQGDMLTVQNNDRTLTIPQWSADFVDQKTYSTFSALQNTVAQIAEKAQETHSRFNPEAVPDEMEKLKNSTRIVAVWRQLLEQARRAKRKIEDDLAVLNRVPPATAASAATDLAITQTYMAHKSVGDKMVFLGKLEDDETFPIARLPWAASGLTETEFDQAVMRRVRRGNLVRSITDSNASFSWPVTLKVLTPTGVDPEKVDWWLAQTMKNFDYRRDELGRVEEYLRYVVSFYALIFDLTHDAATKVFLPPVEIDA